MSTEAATELPVPAEWLEALASRVAEILDARAKRQRWAPIEGVAVYLQEDVRYVRFLRERGLPAKKIGKRLLFDLREVDAWLERQ